MNNYATYLRLHYFPSTFYMTKLAKGMYPDEMEKKVCLFFCDFLPM